MRVGIIAALPVVALACLLYLGPLPQARLLPHYNEFADQRTLLGVPNFWNVITNVPFLIVALVGLRALWSKDAFLECWERAAYGTLLAGLALIGLGSGYYHAVPSDATLVWDRLPMAIVFETLLAVTIGERISSRAGKMLVVPLLVAGVAAVLYWGATDDLRFYLLAQFYPVVVLPLMLLLFPPRYSASGGVAAMCGFYAIALVLDRMDRPVAAVLAAGGHPWKHVAAALAMLAYVMAVARRRPVLGAGSVVGQLGKLRAGC